MVLFWDDPAPYVEEAHQRGIKVYIQVGLVAEAQAAAEAGVDAVIAQGSETGGHVNSTTALSILVPEVVDAVHPLPVIASGGIANGRGIVSALSLGAQGVSMGTRFLCSNESLAAQEYKDRVVRSKADDTVRTGLFDVGFPDAPHRVLRNTIVDEWEVAERPESGQRPGEGSTIGTVTRFRVPMNLVKYASSSVLTVGFEGDIEQAVLYAGESSSLVNDIKPAGQIVRDLVTEAQEVIDQMKPT